MLSFRHIGWILVSIFLVAYLYYIHIFAVNIPITDDYDLVRVKYTLLTQKFSFWEKIQLLLEPENDHRILVPRSIALSATAIEGYVNYRTIIGVVNLCLFGILGLWFGTFRRQFGLRNYWYFVPVLVFYLNPYVFDVTLWGINGMQHTTLNLLVLGSLYVLSNHTRLFGLAIVLAVMSTFTNGNGFLVFAAGLLVLGLSKDWKRSAVWAAAMVISIGFYFYKYSFGQATQVKLSVLFFQNLVVSFGALVAGWVASFKGQTNNYLWVAFGVGILILGWLVKVLLWEAMRRFWQPRREERHLTAVRNFAAAVFAFSAMTIGIIAISRGGRDVFSVFTSRYSLYPLHLLTLTYLTLLWHFPRLQSWFFRGALAFGLLFATMSYYTWQLDVEVRRRNLIADHYNWRQHRLLATHFRSHLADFFTQPAYDRGIYRFDNFPMASAEAALNAPADTSDLRPLPLTLTTHQKDIDYFGHPQTVAQFRLDNGDLPPVQSGAGEGAYLVLKSSKNVTYLLPTWPIREGRKKFLTSGRLFKEGFSAEFYNENFKKGDYRVGVLTADRHGNQLYYTNNVLRLDSLTAVLNP